MKIVYVADSSSWHNALWTQYFVEKHQCVLFSDFKSDYKPVIFDPRLIRHEHPPVFETGNRHINKIISAPFYVHRLRDLCAEFKPDVIHAVALYYGVLGSFAASCASAPLIYTLQGSEVLLRARSARVYARALRRVSNTAALVTGDSNAILNAAIELGLNPDKCALIQNGVRLEQFKPGATPDAVTKFRKRLDFPHSCSRIICSPRGLIPLYNIPLILRSIAGIMNSRPEIGLMFVYGFGEEHLAELQLLAEQLGISERCRWLGYVDHSEMRTVYEISELVVSIPTSDSSPKSVYEAVACGVPVVVSDLHWVHEHFAPKNALYRCTLELTSVQNAINNALIDVENRNTGNRDRSLEIVRDRFSYQDNMARMERLMLQVVDKARVRR